MTKTKFDALNAVDNLPPPGTPDYHLSFSGCGFQGLYHIGVASCIQRHAPYLFNGKVAGCSAGGLIAACAVCNCRFAKILRETSICVLICGKIVEKTEAKFLFSFALLSP